MNLIVDELTKKGVMGPERLLGSREADHAPTRPDYLFRDADVIVATLQQFRPPEVPKDLA